MKKLLALGTLLSVSACDLEPKLPRLIKLEPAAAELRIEHVRLFDSVQARMVTDQTVVVHASTISWTGPATAATLPSPATNAVVINGRGKTLLPGLVDAHVHLGIAGAPPWQMRMANVQRNLDSWLMAGVTTIIEPGGFSSVSNPLRDGIRAGTTDGPDLYTAGPVFTATDGHPFPMMRLQIPGFVISLIKNKLAYLVDSEDELPGALKRFDASGADFMKLIVDEIPFGAPVLKDPIITGAVAHAHEKGLKVFAHVGSPADAMRSARAGVDVLAHTPYAALLSPAEVVDIHQRGMTVMSTQQIWANTVALANSKTGLPLRPMAKEVFDPEVSKVLEAPRPDGWAPPKSFAPWLDFIASDKRYQVTNLHALYAAGVTIVVATDSPNLGMAAGDAMHAELEQVVAAGIPPAEALRDATLVPARLLVKHPDVGSIAAGKRADMLLLDADPTVDIRNSEKINTVYTRGRRVVRLEQPH